jgi:exosortase A
MDVPPDLEARMISPSPLTDADINATGTAVAWRRHAAAAAFALLALGLLYHETFVEMVGIWSRSQTFNHCFLVLPIALYLGYTKRHVLARLTPGTSALGAAWLAANGIAWLAGHVLSAAALEHAAAVGLLIGAGWALVGNAAFRVLLVPFFYLYFAVPFGEFLVPHLQDWTATVLVWALRMTGMPVFLEGRYLSIPSGQFVVAEACSGINYLIATLAVGTMYMYVNFAAWWRRALFMAAAVAVPLIANGLRAYGIVMIAHHSDYRHAMGVDHFVYGWVFFGIVIFALFAVTAPFADRTDATDRAQLPRVPSRAAPCARPWRMAVVLVALLALPVALAMLGAARTADSATVDLPELPGWRGPLAVDASLGAEFRGAADYRTGLYVDAAGREVTIEIAYFTRDEEGAELINQTNRVFDPARWRRIGEERRAGPPGSDIEQVNVVRLRHVDSGVNHALWRWYDANGLRSANPFPIKLAQAAARLGFGSPGAAAVMLLAREDVAADVLAALAREPALRLDALAPPAP